MYRLLLRGGAGAALRVCARLLQCCSPPTTALLPPKVSEEPERDATLTVVVPLADGLDEW